MLFINKSLLVKVGDILRVELKRLGLTLIDFKIELGFDGQRNICVADEITPDIWRVQDASGSVPNQIDCAEIVLKSLGGYTK